MKWWKRRRMRMPQADPALKPSEVRVGSKCLAVLQILNAYGELTDEEIRSAWDTLRWPRVGESTIRARRCELRDRGMVESTGSKVQSTGCRGQTWAITPEGRAALIKG